MYRLEFTIKHAGKHTTRKPRRLSVSSHAPFAAEEVEQYRQMIAERETHDRGAVILASMIDVQTVQS